MSAITIQEHFLTAKDELIDLLKKTLQTSWDLGRIMVPILLLTKILQDIGGVEFLGRFLSPVMGWVGLPGSMALVWAMSILVSPYGSLLLFASLAPGEALTVAQVTVLSTMILMAHAVPIEVRIAQKAGLRTGLQLFLRFGSAFLLGWLLHQVYSLSGYLQMPNQTVIDMVQQDTTWGGWALGQIKSLCMIFLIIFALLLMLKILEKIGALKLIKWLLAPLLRFLGMSAEAAPITIIGITLGLGLGGGLVIQEAKSGSMDKHDIVFSLTLMILFHSLIEDTIAMLVMGAHLSGILWARLLFTIIMMLVFGKIVNLLPSDKFDRWLYAEQ